MSGLDSRSNIEILTDCLSVAIVNSITQRERRRHGGGGSGGSGRSAGGKAKKSKDVDVDVQSEVEELQDYIDYVVNELWDALPEDVKTLSYENKAADGSETVGTIEGCAGVLNNLPVSYSESLIHAEVVEDEADVQRLTTKALEAYLETCAPRKSVIFKHTRTEECEMCGRNVVLTYHHLIPRSTHARVLKKGIHPEHMLNRVAWLCRPCHSTVHHVEDNMELAKNWYTVELLMGRQDIQRWVSYISKRPGKINGR